MRNGSRTRISRPADGTILGGSVDWVEVYTIVVLWGVLVCVFGAIVRY